MTGEFTLAIHALVYLLHKQTQISSEELAENICTNPARVRKVMARLHKAGLVQASRGKGSGYQAIPETAALSLERVLSALEEEPLELNWHSGNMDKECLISSGMGAIMEGLYTDMNRACRRELSAVTIGGINRQIFRKKGALL